MSYSDLIKTLAKAVHESVHGDAKDAKIKQLERTVAARNEFIGEIEDAIRYCKNEGIDFDSMDEAVDIYREREIDEADKADFDNQLKKEDF